jgi:hypothetical protein
MASRRLGGRGKKAEDNPNAARLSAPGQLARDASLPRQWKVQASGTVAAATLFGLATSGLLRI